MSLSVNSQSCVPPGFRFHPTEEELLNYYLRKKVASEKIDLDVIRDVDINKLEPWDIQEKCRIGSTPPNGWYFFSHRDRKYPTGTRTNRATVAGFWKATGRDKVIYTSSERIGMRKTLVFYKGRAPHGQKSDWIMHEYRLEDDHSHDSNGSCSSITHEDGWVVCRVFKKKNFHEAMDGPNDCDAKSAQLLRNGSSGDGALDQILQYMGRSCKQETSESTAMANNLDSPTDRLPPLTDDFPIGDIISSYQQPDGIHAVVAPNRPSEPNLSDWAALDRLLASHLNGQSDDHEFMLVPGSHEGGGGSGNGDPWSLASSASDHTISHASHASI